MRKSSSTNGINIDDPSITIERSEIIKKKFFLKMIYKEFYTQIYDSLSVNNRQGKIVELGSGGGFIKEIIPSIITSDIMPLPNVDMHFSALKMPFKKNSLNAIVMIDVLHHINNVELFFTEANRCLKKNGQIIMIEPSNTLFGGFIYKYFHHEPYNPKGGWKFKTTGPLSGANAALPWIVFFRDRKRFEKKYPNLKIEEINAHTPFLYILSGGFSYQQLLPSFFFSTIQSIENVFNPLHGILGLFYTISIKKTN